MAVQEAEDVYASLLLTDTYLPGALVLAHSLRDAGTTKKLAILVTLDTVSVEVVEQLKTVYDYVIPVDRIQTEHPANLDLMGRRDLHSAFTKINLWRQTQFRKIVYVDADIVAYRAPDELFDLPHAFSAAPDIGWPDLFNTGVMVLAPNMGDYHALTAMAQKGISFDGADQGLLNMYYKNSFNRLSFTYNVTPSAHYQYVPAYKHFQSSINMVHFIGPEKPWVQGRGRATESSPFDNMVGRWWAVYDRHYGKETQQAPEIVRYFVKGEFQPTIRQSPPADSRPEAMNFPQTHYAMSTDPAPFVPPERYPSPPKDMWYEVPKQAPEKPKPLFPWEAHQPRPTRVFGHPAQPERTAQPSSQAQPKPDAAATQPGRPHTPPESGPNTRTAPSPAATTDTWSSFSLTNAWDNVPEINRYVDRRMQQHRRSRSGKDLAAPGGSGGGSPGGPGDGGVSDLATPRRGSKVTDFPSEDDRPSLPVTPAPIRRPGGGLGGDGGSGDDGKEQLLQGAEGVPGQDDWDPATQLQKLAKEQSELAFRRLGAGDDGEGGEEADRAIPSRPLPFGSEGVKSPTYVAPAPPVVSPKPVKPTTGTSQANRILASAPGIR